MDVTHNQPSARRALSWFLPVRRDIGAWAFALNRVTAIGLTIYLFLHLGVLSLLAMGPQAYEQFLVLTENPLIKLGEMLVVAAGIMHGLNGIRIALTSFGIGVTRQKQMFYALLVVAALLIAMFALRMYR